MRNLRRGFTLLELLVVIGIIVLLATILLPMVNHAYQQANRSRMAADLQVISQALENYKRDFGDYPRPMLTPKGAVVTGAAVLCWAMVAPGPQGDGAGIITSTTFEGADGADGPGFRLRGTTGAVKGPYLPADTFKVGVADRMGLVQSPPNGYNDTQNVLADRFSAPILYWVAARNAIPTLAPNGFISPNHSWPTIDPFTRQPVPPIPPSVFSFDDNKIYLKPSPPIPRANAANLMTDWKVMAYRLGDVGTAAASGAPNGVIDPNETAIATGPYLLWCAGPDGIFGSNDDVVSNGSELQLNTGPLPFVIPP